MLEKCIFWISLALSLDPGFSKQSYTTHSLERFCRRDGSKQEIPVYQSRPQIYTFNSTVTTLFQCHLELELSAVNRRGVGFTTYFDNLNIVQSTDCSYGDYVQFGKDVLFITSYKSQKFCKKTSMMSGGAGASGRVHKQEGNEMDIWIQLQPGHKELTLIITPFVGCSTSNSKYKLCPNSSECVKTDLFCDGAINCANGGLDEDLRFCPHIVEPGGVTESPLGIPFIIVICVGVVLAAASIFFLAKESLFRYRGATGGEPNISRGSGPRGGGAEALESQLRREDIPLNQEELPADPPPYSEVVAGYDQDPPKYSTLEKIHSDI